MARFEALTPDNHGSSTLKPNAGVTFAAGQHMLFLRAEEVARAANSFPVFLNRAEGSGTFVLSAIAGFQPGENLFVEGGEWRAAYQPTIMQTYPFTLVPSSADPAIPAIAVDADSPALATGEGERLYEHGQETILLSRIRAMLEANIDNDRQTAAFVSYLDKGGLIKAVDLIVRSGEQTQTITGLHTVDEERLRALPDEEVVEIHRSGYLMLCHALLMSIGQLNAMIDLHNRREGNAPITEIRIEVGRDRSQGDGF